ncbi:MAG: DUF4276 family protein [Tannerella sp.]|jgi:hypothetical protein|nr:DUF4276 family protein [Tannerella sp.]
MKRVIVICEGHTEREFCQKTLYNYFLKKNIAITAVLIKKSNGGIVKWKFLKEQIENHLKEDHEVYVTLLYDKIVYGNIIAETIGLDRIINKSPRFGSWIGKISRING